MCIYRILYQQYMLEKEVKDEFNCTTEKDRKSEKAWILEKIYRVYRYSFNYSSNYVYIHIDR
nr:MAG TPA: hypothetical protein [Caudoviricetes sp.]